MLYSDRGKLQSSFVLRNLGDNGTWDCNCRAVAYISMFLCWDVRLFFCSTQQCSAVPIPDAVPDPILFRSLRVIYPAVSHIHPSSLLRKYSGEIQQIQSPNNGGKESSINGKYSDAQKNEKPTVIEYLPERESLGNSDVSGCYPLEQQQKFRFDLANIQGCGTME